MLVPGAPAGAMTVENYQKWRMDSRNLRITPEGILEIRLLGSFQGMVLSARETLRKGGTPHFCPPEDAEIGGRDLRGMLDEELKGPTTEDGRPHPGDASVDGVLMTLLARRWPCPGTGGGTGGE